MNDEQLIAEFEAWKASRPAGAGYSAEEAYVAAAQSRDELIGKLVNALATCRINKSRLDNDSGYAFDEDDVKQALAEAKAQRYGE